MLGRRAWPARRLARLGATPAFHQGPHGHADGRRQARAANEVYVDASYSAVMAVMDRLHEAHIDNVGLITRTPPAAGEAGRGAL